MSTITLYQILQLDTVNLRKSEKTILEAEIFIELCKGLKEFFRKKYENYFSLLKFTKNMEDQMLEANFARLIINDIISTGLYSLSGIALYTGIHEDVIQDLASGSNIHPSALSFRKTIELHATVRNEMYTEILAKTLSQNSKLKKLLLDEIKSDI